MFNRKKSNIANITHLRSYQQLVACTDNMSSIKIGDIVQLKSFPFINDKYAGCVSILDKKSADKHYAYVVEINNVKQSEHIGLGSIINMRIATVDNGSINIETCDSRMFCKAKDPNINKILAEFIDDVPINEFKIGMLVRPRCGLKFKNKDKSPYELGAIFKVPMVVLAISEYDNVIVAGSADLDIIEEIEVRKYRLCEWIQQDKYLN